MDGDLRPPGGRDGWARRGEGAGLWASSSSRRLFDADELTCLPSCGHGRWERKQGQRCGWRAPRTEPGGASSASFASEWAEREWEAGQAKLNGLEKKMSVLQKKIKNRHIYIQFGRTDQKNSKPKKKLKFCFFIIRYRNATLPKTKKNSKLNKAFMSIMTLALPVHAERPRHRDRAAPVFERSIRPVSMHSFMAQLPRL